MGCGGSKEDIAGFRETLKEHQGPVNCMAISQDNSILCTGSDDKTVRMWSAKTPKVECIGVLEGHTSYVTSCAVTDTFVISGSDDGTLRKWCMTKCECEHVYEGHQSTINRVISTGEFIFSSSYDTTVKAWFFDREDIRSNGTDCIKSFIGHSKGVFPIIFIPSDGIPSEAYNGKININAGDTLITGSADCTARAWAFDTGEMIRVFEGHTGPITCMATDPQGKILFTGSSDNTIRSWSISKGQRLNEFTGHTAAIVCLQSGSRLIYSGSQDMTARGWVGEFGNSTKVYEGHESTVTALMVYYNKLLFTGCGDKLIRVYNVRSGELLQIFKGHTSVISALVIVEFRLYSGSSDGTIRVWDITKVLKSVQIGTSIQAQIGRRIYT